MLLTSFSFESVISFAKCSLSGLSPSDADELELYAERWQLSGARFTDGELWNMMILLADKQKFNASSETGAWAHCNPTCPEDTAEELRAAHKRFIGE